MNTSKTPAILIGLTLLIVINISGAMLLKKTLTQANEIDHNLAAQAEQIGRSIAIAWQYRQLDRNQEQRNRFVQQLLTIERVEATLFIDADGQTIARSGANIPHALVDTFKQTETYSVRQNNLLYLSQPITEPDYGSGGLTDVAVPRGYIILGLNTTSTDHLRELLCSYAIGGAVLLGCINLILFIFTIGYFRRLSIYRNAPPEIQQQYAKGYRQLKHSIAMQQQAIDQARQEALKISEIKSQFIANMSHEIRTPLNAIIGFTDLLLKSPLDARQMDFLSTIKKSSLGLLQIIHDILDFSKIEAGKVALDEIALDLREIIEDVLTVLAPSAHEKQLELVAIYAPNLPNQLLADPLRLKQILTNLVSNAIKFTRKGSIAIRLGMEEKTGDTAIFKISVTDTGIGIAKEKQQKLFQVFSQADTTTTRQFGGSGLGLVIAKQLTEQMNGEIGVNSQLNHGANFWFTFHAKITQNLSKTGNFNALVGRRIALYDSHPLVRMSLSQLLKEWQIDVVTTGNLEELEAIIESSAETTAFDVAIISLNFSALNKQDYCSLANQLDTKYQCPTLLLNYTVEANTAPSGLVGGETKMLSKPIRYQELYQALMQLTNTHEQTASNAPQPQENETVQFDRPPKVLVVDDNPANLQLVSSLLGDIGSTVTEADGGLQALEQLKVHSFDLIFMDIQMPGMDGVEVTRLIRRKPSLYRDIPIIALTAHALASEKSELLRNGMDDYLSKPVTEQQLVDTILQWTDINLVKVQQPCPNNTPPPPTQPFELPVDHELEATTPIVDLPLAIKLAGDKEELAKELFQMLLNNLDKELSDITQTLQKKDFKNLLFQVHRLHGAARYCGVPALRDAAEGAEIALKQQRTDEIDQLISRIIFESEQIKLWAKSNPWVNSANSSP